MHLLLCADDSQKEFLGELQQEWASIAPREAGDLLYEADFPLAPNGAKPVLCFLRQLFPNATLERAESISAWARLVVERLIVSLPENEPWSLQVAAHYGARKTHRIGARAWHSASRRPIAGAAVRDNAGTRVAAFAGQHRATLVEQAILQLLEHKRRRLVRSLRCFNPALPFAAEQSHVQLLLITPTEGYVSIAVAPMPYAHRQLIAFFKKGEIPIASDKQAPSRAFAKLVEAELRLGRKIQPGEVCVDLGAAPGSWSYVAIQRGARVLAVDRAPLREDLMRNPHVEFCPGDGFRFKPRTAPVDWLLCDVIAPAEASAGLLLQWLRARWCRHFVVTLKVRDTEGMGTVTKLKHELPALTCDFFLTRLCANKKELTVFGSVEL